MFLWRMMDLNSNLGKRLVDGTFHACPFVPTADFAPVYMIVLILYSSIAFSLNSGLDGIS
jgi:hypothetical protein